MWRANGQATETWASAGVYGAKVEYLPNAVGSLRGRQLSYEDFENIARGIAKDGKDACVEAPSVGLDMDYFDWTTGIDFGHEYEGGGYLIGFSDENENYVLDVAVEWLDGYTEEAGMLERADEDTCVRIGLSLLNEFLAAL